MSLRFRPELNALETREVPAAFSALLSDGSTISGLFSTPSGTDPTQLNGQYTLSDLTVTKSVGGTGTSFNVQTGSTATATYASGVLTSVNATLQNANNSGDVMVLAQNSVQEGAVTGSSIAYDGAPTQYTFQLPNGVQGAISYTIPASQIDPTQATQSLTLTSFNLNIGGQTFSYAASTTTTSAAPRTVSQQSVFSSAPTLQVAQGTVTGVDFALSITNNPSSFTSFSMAGLSVTAVQGGVTSTVTAAGQTNFIGMDFSKVKSAQAYEVTIAAYDGANLIDAYTFRVPANATPAQVALLAQTAMKGDKIFSVSVEGGLVVVSAPKNVKWSSLKVTITDIQGNSLNVGGPAFGGDAGGVFLYVNGKLLQP